MTDKTVSLIFFGTPEFAKTVLQRLLDYKKDRENKVDLEIVAVITAPDTPIGRKQILTPSPVKQLAIDNTIPVYTPQKLDENFINFLDSKFVIHNSKFIFLLAAYNKIVPQALIDLPSYGFLNIHPSFLPEWRGPSPIQSAIMSGQTHTGVSIMQLDEKVDHGPLIAEQGVKIEDNETTNELGERLFKMGTDLLLQILPVFVEGEISGIPQNESKATFTRKITSDDGFIKLEAVKKAMEGQRISIEDLPQLSQETVSKNSRHTPFATSNKLIHDFIRALSPEPNVWTIINSPQKNNVISSERIEARDPARVGKTQGDFSPPARNDISPKRLKLLKSHMENNRLVLDLVQLEGKNPVPFKQFQDAYPNIL